MLKTGLLITFEGIDGSGKSTIINKLNEKLNKYFEKNNLNINLIQTREPGGNNNLIAEKIRNLILDKNYEIPDITEAFLFAASRSAHIELTIKPALKNKQIILCDRFLDSSIIYQGFVKKIGSEAINQINQYAIDGVYPNLTFYFKIDPTIAQKRMNNHNRKNDRIDKMNLEFHQNVSHYYDLHFLNKKNVIQIDANQTIDKIVNECLDKIIECIKNNYEY